MSTRTVRPSAGVQPGTGGPSAPFTKHIVCVWCYPGPRQPGQICVCGHVTRTSNSYRTSVKQAEVCVVCKDLAPAHVRSHLDGSRKEDQ